MRKIVSFDIKVTKHGIMRIAVFLNSLPHNSDFQRPQERT